MVTGARQGLGRAICIALAGSGYDIIGVDTGMEGARDTGLGVIAAGARFDFRLADITRPEMVEALLTWAWTACDGVEVLVAGAEMPMAAPQGRESALGLAAAMVQRMAAGTAPERGRRGLVLLAGEAAGREEVLPAGLTASLAEAAIPLLLLRRDHLPDADGASREGDMVGAVVRLLAGTPG